MVIFQVGGLKDAKLEIWLCLLSDNASIGIFGFNACLCDSSGISLAQLLLNIMRFLSSDSSKRLLAKRCRKIANDVSFSFLLHWASATMERAAEWIREIICVDKTSTIGFKRILFSSYLVILFSPLLSSAFRASDWLQKPKPN